MLWTMWSSSHHFSSLLVRVFRFASGNQTEDLNTTASLIKTIQFPGFHLDGLLCNGLVFGCLLRSEENLSELSLVPFEEKALLARAN